MPNFYLAINSDRAYVTLARIGSRVTHCRFESELSDLLRRFACRKFELLRLRNFGSELKKIDETGKLLVTFELKSEISDFCGFSVSLQKLNF